MLDTKRKVTLLAIGMLLVTLSAGCTSSGDEEFYRVSKKLLEIDKLWTDVTTYPAVWERATGRDLPFDPDLNTLWRDEELGTFIVYFNQRFPLHGDPALFELISMAVPEELSGIKLGLVEVYRQELLAIEIGEWNPKVHQGNIEEIRLRFNLGLQR